MSNTKCVFRAHTTAISLHLFYHNFCQILIQIERERGRIKLHRFSSKSNLVSLLNRCRSIQICIQTPHPDLLEENRLITESFCRVYEVYTLRQQTRQHCNKLIKQRSLTSPTKNNVVSSKYNSWLQSSPHHL